MDNAPTGILQGTLPFPKAIDNLFFTGNGAKSVTVPAGARYVVISATALCFAKTDGAAAVPAGDIADQSGVLILTTDTGHRYNVKAVATLSIIPDPDAVASAATGIWVSLCWYGDPSA